MSSSSIDDDGDGGGAGRTIADRYELVAPIGQGGMGVVWRARDRRLGRAVAIKLLAAASLGSDVARKRLIREARAAAALDHDGIVRVYDVGETDDGGAYLVMELVRGSSMRELISRLPGPSASQVISIVIRAARALHVAHQAGIIHRDVKPDNIMIRDNGAVIVVDFGVAKPITAERLEANATANAETIAGVTNLSLTSAGQLIGTPAYLAPEQARGVEVSAATDQFALAVTAFEALTNESPWTGAGVVEIVAAILRDEPRSLTKLAPAVPAAIEAVLLRALEKDPKKRFETIDELASALEEASTDLPAASRRTPPPPTPQEPDPKLNTQDALAITEPREAGTKSKRPLFLAAIAVLAACGFYAFYTYKDDQKKTVAAPAAALATATSNLPLIACPPFTVTGVNEPWLGAAGALLACDRFAIIYGGLDSRTVNPPELANVPRELGTKVDPMFEHAEDRVPLVEAAKRRAQFWMDGVLDKQPSGYVAKISVHSGTGGDSSADIAHGEGRGIEMFEAIRAALAPIIAHPSFAPTKADLARLHDELDVDSPDAALDLLDLRTASLIEDPVSLKEACAKIDGQSATLAPRVASLTKATCIKKLRTGAALPSPPPPIDESTTGALITTSLAQAGTGGSAAVRERAARLEKAREAATSLETKSRLAAAAAEIYNMIGDEHARDLVRSALRDSPKAVDWRMSGWHRFAFSSQGDASSSLATWQGWEPIAQSLRGTGMIPDPPTRIVAVTRTYLLAQRGYYAYGFGAELLSQGRIEEARGVSELTQDELLRVDILLAEAKYGALLAKINKLVTDLPATDETASLAFRIAQVGVRATTTLNRPADFVDSIVTRWVEAEPHHIVDGVVPFSSLITACCLAPRSVGKRCLDRITQLRAESKLPTIFNGSDTVITGASYFVANDYRNATKAWRTFLRTPGWIQDPLRDVMAIAFDKAGEIDIGSEIDGPTLKLIDLPRTADLAWVREAHRAAKRGDHAKARVFARAVLDKWRFADEDIPAMTEMRDLLVKLPKE